MAKIGTELRQWCERCAMFTPTRACACQAYLCCARCCTEPECRDWWYAQW
jgi:hypothetical protein